MLSENGDVIKIDTTGRQTTRREYPKWRTAAPMWLQFRANFAGRYIEMNMRRVHLSMPTEGIKAFSKRIQSRPQSPRYPCPAERENEVLWENPF